MSDPPAQPARDDRHPDHALGSDPSPTPHPTNSHEGSRNITPIRTRFNPFKSLSRAAAHPHSMDPYTPSPEFRSQTTAPSPPRLIDTSDPTAELSSTTTRLVTSSSGSSSICVHAAQDSASPTRPDASEDRRRLSAGYIRHKTSSSSLAPVSRTPSIKRALESSAGSGSGSSSIMPSPIISALGDVTPLPSPLLSHHSPGPWRIFARPPSMEAISPFDGLTESPRTSLDRTLSAARRGSPPSLQPESAGRAERPDGATSAPRQPSHGRNRSISLYAPDSLAMPRRHATVSGPHAEQRAADPEHQMRRELHLAEARGITKTTVAKPPTPPPSESSRDASEGTPSDKSKSVTIEGPEVFEAHDRHDGKKRRWRAVRFLGQGTFSRVILATSQMGHEDEEAAEDSEPDRKTLVAVKVLEHGPRGGASEDRIEMSLKRELEIMKDISHPSLVHLRAWNIEPSRAILVLSYCPGGDLFDVATAHREVLTPALMRRMFAELVGAVKYLHERLIVHRDIKLENVLVNMTPAELADPTTDWTTYPHPVITLADLGLARRIAPDEKLETRCGSDDYAAPEVVMGQTYDGRSTDAWSLGVLLYALLEARLPFDPHPDAHRMRSRTSHRIARVEWRWVTYGGGDEDGDHEADVAKFEKAGLTGAMEITEGLLKRARSRWSVEKVSRCGWVGDAFAGLAFREEEKGAEI